MHSSESCPRHPADNRDSVNALEAAAFLSQWEQWDPCLDAASGRGRALLLTWATLQVSKMKICSLSSCLNPPHPCV